MARRKSATVQSEAAAPAPTNGTSKGKKSSRPKVRLVSENPKYEGLWVRAYVDVLELHGVPLDPDGVPMVPGKASHGGASAEQRAAKKAAKAAEEALFASMSDEEKLAYAKAKREERAAKRAAKKAAERDKLIAQIREELKAGTLSLD